MSGKDNYRCMIANDWKKNRGALPSWFYGVCRRYLQRARNTDEHFRDEHAVHCILHDNRWYWLFDHFGFIVVGRQSILYTQPYLSDYVSAQQFADALGIEIISQNGERGAHHESTYLYQFRLKTTHLEA